MRRISYVVMLCVVLLMGAVGVQADEAVTWVNSFGRGTITRALLSVDGSRLAVGGSLGVSVYDVDFTPLAQLETGSVQKIAWSSDDRYLAVLTQDERLTLWEMQGYTRHAEIDFPEAQPLSRYAPMAWRPDSPLLAISFPDRVALWNADTGRFDSPIITGDFNSIKTDLAWSPDGDRLALGIRGGLIILPFAREPSPLHVDLHGEGQPYQRWVWLDWSPDGTRLAVAEYVLEDFVSQHNTLSIIAADSGEILQVMQAGMMGDVAWSPDGRRIATATSKFGERTTTPIRIWDTETGRLMAQLQGHTREAHTVQWHPDGQHLLSAAMDNTVRIWPVQPQDIIEQWPDHRVLPQHMGPVTALTWSPDQHYVTVGSKDGSIRIWDVATGVMLETDYRSDMREVQALAYSPNGRYLAAGGGENLVRIWKIDEDHSRLEQFSYFHGRTSIPGAGNPIGITALAWRPDSGTLASAGYDAAVKLWRPHTSSAEITLRHGGWYPLSLQWFADGERLFIGTRWPEAWNTATGEQLELPPECSAPEVIGNELSPDEQSIIISGDIVGEYQYCALDTGELGPSWGGYRRVWGNPVHSLVVGWVDSPAQNEIILFDPATFDRFTGETLAEIMFDAPVRRAAWSDDGRYLALGLEDGTVHVWDVINLIP
jgi:WD40 repeat protein